MIYENEDANRDGIVTFSEFTGPKRSPPNAPPATVAPPGRQTTVLKASAAEVNVNGVGVKVSDVDMGWV